MEERVKIRINKQADVVAKIGNTPVFIKRWLNIDEVAYIIDETCSYFKQLISDGQNDAVVLTSTFAKMDMLTAFLATNVDLTDLDADEVGSTGLFNLVRENLYNYDMIKNAVIVGTSMIGDSFIIEQMGNVASLDDLEKAQNQIEGFMNKDENSDKVKFLIEAMLANNPALANELDNLVAKGDVEDGIKE